MRGFGFIVDYSKFITGMRKRQFPEFATFHFIAFTKFEKDECANREKGI
jgi:hypothetical protein